MVCRAEFEWEVGRGQKPKQDDALMSAVTRLRSKEKSPRTLMLETASFVLFQEICKDRDLKPSHLVDEWIRDFVEKCSKNSLVESSRDK